MLKELKKIKSSSFLFLLYVLIVVLLIVGNYSYTNLGFAEDSDSRAIVESFYGSHNGYLPSRVLGVPLYEEISRYLYDLGGLKALNIYSYTLWLLSIISIFLIFNFLNLKHKLFFSLAFGFHPLIVINSTIPMETMQSLFLSIIFLYSSIRYYYEKNNIYLYLAVLFGILATLTRPDNIFLVFTLFLFFIITKKNDKKMYISGIFFCVFVSLVFILKYNFFVSFSGVSLFPVIDLRYLVRFFLSPTYLFGIFVFPLIFFLKYFNVFPYRKHEKNTYSKSLKYLLIIATIVYIVRWAILPDEIEYLINYFLIFFIFIVLNLNYKFLMFIFLSIYSQFIFVPYLLEKDITYQNNNIENKYSFSPGITTGILNQNNIIRNSNQNVIQKDFIEKIKFVPPLEAKISSIEFPPYLNAILLNNRTLITGLVGLSQIFKQPKDELQRKNIYLCSTNIIPNRGWRSFQKIQSIDYSKPITCKKI